MTHRNAPFAHRIDGGDHLRSFDIRQTGDLTVRCDGGRIRVGTTIYEVTPVSIELPINQTSYVYLWIVGTPVLMSDITGYPNGSFPLARVLVGNAIQDVFDDRSIFGELFLRTITKTWGTITASDIRDGELVHNTVDGSLVFRAGSNVHRYEDAAQLPI